MSSEEKPVGHVFASLVSSGASLEAAARGRREGEGAMSFIISLSLFCPSFVYSLS